MTIHEIRQTINADYTWPAQPYPVYSGKPAANTLTALCWDEVSTATGPRSFDVSNRDGKTHRVTVNKHVLYVLDCLMRRPLKSASIARIGEYVARLRRDHSVEIHCERHECNEFGAYYLMDKVERVKAEVPV